MCRELDVGFPVNIYCRPNSLLLELKMIVDIKNKNVFFTPPKCHSTSVHKYFAQKHPHSWRIMGPQFGTPVYEKHTVELPFIEGEFSYYCLIRNPWGRAVSLWNHCKRYHSPRMPFKTFVQAGLLSGVFGRFFCDTVYKILYPRLVWDKLPVEFLQVENLGTEMHRLGYDYDPDQWIENQGARRNMEGLEMSVSTQNKVLSWGDIDFKLGEYTTRIPEHSR